MNLSEIEVLFEQINDCIEFYEKTYIKNKVFTLYLGNGEKIKYTINPNNVPHLLGINLDVVKTTYNYSEDSSYELLKNVCKNAYKLYSLFNSGVLKQELVFSKNIKEKVACFKNNFSSHAKEILEQTEFVCNFKREKSWEITDKNQKYDYIIVKEFPDGKITLLCLVKKGAQCYVMSNQLFDSIEEANESFKELFTNQEITLLTGISIYNIYNDSNYDASLTTNQKLDKISDLKYYKENFGSNIDVVSDYQYTVGKLRNNRYEKNENRTTMDDIIECIVNKTLISRNEYSDSALIGIIDAWNDHICINANNLGGNAEYSYTEAIKNLKILKEKTQKLESENNSLKEEISALKEKNGTLLEENKQHIEDKAAIMKILKPEN